MTDNLPVRALTVRDDAPLQIWGFATSAFVSPSIPSFVSIFSFVLQLVFFLLAAPRIELAYGRARFVGVFFAATAVGSAIMVLSGFGAYGLGAGMWGLFGSYLVVIWEHREARTQYMIILGALLLFTIVQRDFQLAGVIAGGLTGVGVILVLRRFADRPGSHPRTPILIVTVAVALVAVAAVLRGLADAG